MHSISIYALGSREISSPTAWASATALLAGVLTCSGDLHVIPQPPVKQSEPTDRRTIALTSQDYDSDARRLWRARDRSDTPRETDDVRSQPRRGNPG